MRGPRESTAAAFRFAAVIVAAGVLAACQSLFPGTDRPPPDYYDLTPKSTFDEDLPQINAQFIIETPTASAGLSTARIAIKTHPTRLNYYENAEWSDVAPRMVQTLVIESFENTDRVIGVSREGAGLQSDYMLAINMREFQAEIYDGRPLGVRVRLSIRLVRMPDRVIIAGTSVERLIEPETNELQDVVIAFDDALGKVVKRVVQWTIRTAHEDMLSRARRGGS